MQSESPTWKIKLLYDGACPLCLREVNFLRRKDAGRGLVKFVDIADPSYSAAEHGNIDFATAMAVIHAIRADGVVLKNVEVFRQIYDLLGMGWIYAITKVPIVGAIADFVYRIWADYRLPLTGRPNLAVIIQQRLQANQCDVEGRCDRQI
jgi:predicted DCC family thiol-disulfide oxidoreductase YuxK